MSIEMRMGDDADKDNWNAIVDNSATGTIFHTWQWLKIAEKYSDSQLYPIIIHEKEEILGIIPLFLRKKFGLKLVLSPPPSVAILFLGPVYSPGDEKSQSQKELDDIHIQNKLKTFIFQELKADYVHVSLSPHIIDLRPYVWDGYTMEPHYDYVIPLSSTPEEQLAKLSRNLRQNLNRAAKRGFLVEEGGKPEINALYDLMVERYKDQDKRVSVPRNYLLDIYDSFHENLKIFIAKIHEEMVTGCATISYKGEFISWIGSPKPKTKISPSPNDLLTWNELKYGSSHGLKTYIILGAAGNQRLHSYYAKFDPELRLRISIRKTSHFGGLLEKGYKVMKNSRNGLRRATRIVESPE